MPADIMLISGIILATVGLILVIITNDEKKLNRYFVMAGLGLALLAGVLIHVALWFF